MLLQVLLPEIVVTTWNVAKFTHILEVFSFQIQRKSSSVIFSQVTLQSWMNKFRFCWVFVFSFNELTELTYSGKMGCCYFQSQKKCTANDEQFHLETITKSSTKSDFYSWKPYFYNILTTNWLMCTSHINQRGPYGTALTWTDGEVVYSVLSQTSRSFWPDAQLLMSVPSEIESVTAQQWDALSNHSSALPPEKEKNKWQREIYADKYENVNEKKKEGGGRSKWADWKGQGWWQKTGKHGNGGGDK